MNKDRSTTITNSQLKEDYKQTEIGVIPEDWDVRFLVDLAEIRSGIAKNSNALVSNPVLVNYLRVANVQDGFLDLSEMSQLQVNRDDIKRYAVLPGDMLMNEGGDLDKLGRGTLWSGEFNPCVHQNHVFVVRCGSKLVPSYLNSWTGTSASRRYFMLAGRQTTNLASINKTSLGQLPIALPPTKAEQEAIACTLSNIDALIESLDRLLTKKRQIKQGAMQELLRSKEGWVNKSLGEVADFFKGKGLPKSEIIPFATYPCIHYGELFTKYPETILNVKSRTNINTGVFYSVTNDVLMPTSDVTPNGLATASCILEDRVILGGDVLVIRIDPRELNGSFLSYLIRYSKKQIMQLISGTTVYHLYGSDMRNFSFSMPTIEEQIEIANILSDMDAEIGSIESKLTKTRQLKQGMMHELLTGRIRLVDKLK